MNDELLNLLSGFNEVLNKSKEKLDCFKEYAFQSESWLKGELIAFLHKQKELGFISSLDREKETGNGKKKVDIVITFDHDAEAWIELKHWFNGKQKGKKGDATWNPPRYFKDETIGPLKDVDKLVKSGRDNLYLLILNTPNPYNDEWMRGINDFNERFKPRELTPLNFPSKSLGSYFLGLIRIKTF